MINHLSNRAYGWSMATLIAMLGVLVLLIQHAKEIGDAWQWARWVTLALMICAALYALYRFYHQAYMHKLDRDHQKAVTKTLVMPHELEIKRLELEKMKIQLEHDRLVIDAAKCVNPKLAEIIQDSETLIPHAPPFKTMSHLIQEGKMPLCYGADGPVFGTVKDLLSMAISGKPGRGKTTALMYYVSMLLKCGAEVWVLDPHGAMSELAVLNNTPLQGMPATAKVVYLDRKASILASVEPLTKELDSRDDLYHETKQTKHPLMLIADELPVLSVWDDEQPKGSISLLSVIQRFVLEARKWNGFFIGSGQSFDAKVMPTIITESLSSRIVFFSSDKRARMSGLEKEAIEKYLPLVRRAGPGVMIFDCSRFDEPIIGAIPAMDIEDMLDFLGVSRSPVAASVGASLARDGNCKGSAIYTSLPSVYHAVEATFSKNTTPLLSELEKQIAAKLEAGVSRKHIIQEVWHTQGGRAYQKAVDELDRIITKIRDVA